MVLFSSSMKQPTPRIRSSIKCSLFLSLLFFPLIQPTCGSQNFLNFSLVHFRFCFFSLSILLYNLSFHIFLSVLPYSFSTFSSFSSFDVTSIITMTTIIYHPLLLFFFLVFLFFMSFLFATQTTYNNFHYVPSPLPSLSPFSSFLPFLFLSFPFYFSFFFFTYSFS